jgi:hypothetical protein
MSEYSKAPIKKPTPAVLKIEMGTVYVVPSVKEDHQRIVDLFEAFGYDIQNPQHWLWILSILSKGHFERRRGRPPKWKASTRSQLFVDWFSLQKAGKLEGNRRNWAKLIKENFKLDPLYKNSSEDEIYKNLLKCFREIERATMS